MGSTQNAEFYKFKRKLAYKCFKRIQSLRKPYSLSNEQKLISFE